MAVQMSRQKASSLMERLQGVVDRVIPPEARQQLVTSGYSFANEQPLLATFIAVQIALSAIPLLLFISFTLVTLILVVVAAIGVSAFWIGAALMILIPTLFAALSAGLLVWIWAVGTYLFCRFAYRMTFVRIEKYQPSKSDRKAVTGGRTETNKSRANGTMSSGVSAKQEKPVEAVPDIVKRSINEAHVSPEAAANPEAVEEKKEVEAAIRDEFRDTNEYQRPGGYEMDGATKNESQRIGSFPAVKNGVFDFHSQPE